MKRYDSYKDSGVEWIGKIPSSWVKTKLKYKLQEIVTGGTPNTSNDSFWSDQDNGINWISISDITSNGREITETKKFISEKGLKSKNLQILPIGSLIYSIYGSIGKISRLGIPSTIHQGILSLKTNSTYNTTFLEYYLIYFKEYVSLFSSSNTQENLNQEKVSNFHIPVPPLSEQQEIVSFLDTKTSHIDSLIEKTQQKIELLKEKRTSLINEVVTKGLNPNVEMKDSGIEWVGEIPRHWETDKLKNNSDLKISSVDKHIFEEEIQVIVCNYTDVYYNEFITSKLPLRKGSCSENEYSNFILKRGDVIITKDSESPTDIGVPSLVKENLDNVVCGYHLSIIKSNPKKLVGGYLFRQLQTKRIRSYFEINSNGITRFGLGKSSVLETPLILPPTSEQQQIVEYLDEQTGLIDKTVSIEEKRIELLKEYRQSLISEVVTGKRKVV